MLGQDKVVVTMKPGFQPPAGFPTRLNNSYAFTIGDLAVFEHQLEEAQYELGWDMFEHVPVIYDDFVSVGYVYASIAQILILL